MSFMQPRPTIFLKSLCFLGGLTMLTFWTMMFNIARAQDFDTAQIEKSLSRHEIIQRSLRPHAQNHPALTDAPKYRIEVELDLDLFIYRGTLKLDYKNLERDTLTQLNFLLYPNSKELSGPSERRLLVTQASVNGKPVIHDRLASEVLIIPLHEPLTPGNQASIELTFKGSLFPLTPQMRMSEVKLENLLQTLVHQHSAQGGYGVFSHGDGIVSMALWYPILVAYDERGWDITPSEHIGDRSYFDVAHYDVSLTTSSDAMVATTGVEIGKARRGHLRRSRYVAAGVREFSMQASKEYTKVSAQHGDVTVRSFVTRRYQSNNMPTLNEALSALRTFEEIFGPYPYRELEVAESPLIGGAGGVEFPGLITIASMIFDSAQGLGDLRTAPSNPGKKGKEVGLSVAQDFMQESRDFVIAHEVAHQWWNAVVGSDSRTHPFVDEALANYSAAAHFARTRGAAATQRQIDMMMRLNYHLARLTGMEDQAVDQPTSAFNGLLDYGAIVYGKGALFFWTLRNVLGAEGVHKALSQYYHDHTFRVATGEALRTAISSDQRYTEQVKQLTKRWLDETHGDSDIEAVSLYRTMKIMMGDMGMAQLDPELRRWLNHRGVDALAELVEYALRTGNLDKDRIDYEALTSLLTELMAEDPKVARWARVAGRVLTNPNAEPSDLLKEAGRELKRDDPKTALILESAGLLLDALMMEEPTSNSKRSTQPVQPRHKKQP
jgi:hypothetical protein